jgi:hypothetical protein
VILAAGGVTVTALIAVQPVPVLYVIVAIPVVAPVTMPVLLPAVATMGLLLLHVPPGVLFVKVTDEPEHRVAVPPMAAGGRFTVIVFVVMQPAAAVV